MPADSVKRKSTKTAEVIPDDHRKRRRNRTTQSCLNCHTTKRMCDRKRPCGRCTQLGLTGLCVYEVDDPARKYKNQDERSRLQNRIAELEGVIRELKNKPHPRWADGAACETSLLQSPSRSPASSAKTPPHTGATLSSSFGDMGWVDLLNWDESASGSSGSSYSRSPISTPSPLPVSASRWLESWPPVDASHSSLWSHDAHGPNCNCLSEPICYDTTVELAFELRRATTVLSRSLSHCFRAPCALSLKIRELECLVRNALRDTDALDVPPAAPARAQVYRLPSHDLRVGEQQTKIGARELLWDENGLPAFDDSFMAWIPPPSPLQKMYP